MFLLTIVAITVCALINIYDAKQEVKSSRNAYRLLLKENEKLKEDKEFWKKQEQKYSDYYYEELEKKHKLVDSIKEYKNTIYDLEKEIRTLKKEIWDLQQKDRNLEHETILLRANKNNDDNNVGLRKEIERLTKINNQLMDKIINHLKAKDILTNKTTETIKPAINDTCNWLKIDAHGFSVNKMYTAISNGLVKSFEYDSWINKTLRTMKNSGMKSLRSMCVNPNKPMKLEVEFKLVRGSDTDNPLKSFIDLLVRYYGLTDDNNFVDIHVTRNPIWANSYSDGQIKFKISNI